MSESRLDDLEFRFAHQELAVDELTRQLLEQEKTIERMRKELDYIKSMLKDMAPSAVAPRSEETPPPHY